MKTAVITGASGFLGSHLACIAYQHGFRVRALTRNADLKLFKKVCSFYNLPETCVSEWKKCDILDTDDLENAFEGADVVFHCAAIVAFFNKDREAMYETNVQGTANVVNCCLKLGIVDLIYASSVAAIGRVKQNEVVTENTEWADSKYNSHYAKSKYFAEQEVWRGQEEGLNICIVNPGVILGVGDGKKGSNQIFSITRNGNTVYPVGKTAFVGVKDVCIAMLSLYQHKICGIRVLMVAENIAYKELLTMVAKSMGKKPPFIALGGVLLWLLTQLARALEMFGIPFPYPQQGLKSTSSINRYQSVNSKLIPEFTYTPIAEVISETTKALYPEILGVKS